MHGGLAEGVGAEKGKKTFARATNFAGVAFSTDETGAAATSRQEQCNLSSDTHTWLLVRQIRGEPKKERKDRRKGGTDGAGAAQRKLRGDRVTWN